MIVLRTLRSAYHAPTLVTTIRFDVDMVSALENFLRALEFAHNVARPSLAAVRRDFPFRVDF